MRSAKIIGASVCHPREGRVAGSIELAVLGTPFVVGYQIKGNEVWVLAVMHGARKWLEEF